MQVKVRNGNVDKALSIFKRKSADIIFEVRNREFYEKPSDGRRRKAQVSRIRELRRQAADGRRGIPR